MTSAREQIWAEIEERLNAIPGIGSVARDPEGDPDGFPALELHDDGQTIVEGEAGTERFNLVGRIEGFVRGGFGAAAAAALSDLYVDVVQAVITEPPPAGAETIDQGDLRVQTIQLASEPRKGFALEIAIQFATPRGDPSRFA